MPAKRELTMRQLRYMLRLHHDGVSARAIGRALGVARSTIQDNLRRAAADPLPVLHARGRHFGGTAVTPRRRPSI
jgi:IS30 family transposase